MSDLYPDAATEANEIAAFSDTMNGVAVAPVVEPTVPMPPSVGELCDRIGMDAVGAVFLSLIGLQANGLASHADDVVNLDGIAPWAAPHELNAVMVVLRHAWHDHSRIEALTPIMSEFWSGSYGTHVIEHSVGQYLAMIRDGKHRPEVRADVIAHSHVSRWLGLDLGVERTQSEWTEFERTLRAAWEAKFSQLNDGLNALKEDLDWCGEYENTAARWASMTLTGVTWTEPVVEREWTVTGTMTLTVTVPVSTTVYATSAEQAEELAEFDRYSMPYDLHNAFGNNGSYFDIDDVEVDDVEESY